MLVLALIMIHRAAKSRQAYYQKEFNAQFMTEIGYIVEEILGGIHIHVIGTKKLCSNLLLYFETKGTNNSIVLGRIF